MIHPECLGRNKTGLVVIDIQERFAPAVAAFSDVVGNAVRLVRGFALFGLPMVATEQYPKGLGPTVEPVRSALGDVRAIEKITLSCTLTEAFAERVKGFESLVVCGVETHVCVLQTALGLLHQGVRVHVAADATGSRKEIDHHIALDRLARAGAVVSTVETCLFELAERAGTEEFKALQRLVK